MSRNHKGSGISFGLRHYASGQAEQRSAAQSKMRWLGGVENRGDRSVVIYTKFRPIFTVYLLCLRWDFPIPGPLPVFRLDRDFSFVCYSLRGQQVGDFV